MSRRIVQIAATSTADGVVDYLFALDNNGIAWKLATAGLSVSESWYRLPALPSIDTRPPRPPIAPPIEELDA